MSLNIYTIESGSEITTPADGSSSKWRILAKGGQALSPINFSFYHVVLQLFILGKFHMSNPNGRIAQYAYKYIMTQSSSMLQSRRYIYC